MKRKLLLVALLAVASVAVAGNKQIRDWSFRAPSISDPDVIDPKTAGDIVFDTGTDTFYGWNGSSFIPFSSSGAGSLNVTSKVTADNGYDITSNDDVILASASSGAFGMDLPTASLNSGKVFRIKKTDSTLSAVTLNAADNVDGSGSTTLNTQNEMLSVVSDGSTWVVLERKIPTGWTSYTPTFTGFGTATNIECLYSRSGVNLLLRCKWTGGTGTGTEARVSYPSGLSSASSGTIPSISKCGEFVWNQNGTAGYFLLCEPSVSYATFGVQAAGNSSITKVNGSFFNNSATYSLQISVPISGWQQ